MSHRKLLNSELGRVSPAEYRQRQPGGVVVVLDNIRSAHNVGSAFRTADAFGVDRIYLCGICACPPSAEIHKSALGAEQSVAWEHCDDTLAAVESLRAQGYVIVCVEQTEGAVSLEDFVREDGRRYAVVFGNEVDGVQQSVADAADIVLEIPQWGTKHSLNVSVAVGVILWHFRP
ncbi:MAG: RNA methyltransferase [Bacteroidales bacterium]|nr:RNA methyltransferase [Bacteroidales bacterium]MBR3284919.1 RNA methyltransferase [Bacteroidales bacterium]